MKLWLMRHGQAEPYAVKDAQRSLTEQGRAEVAKMASCLPQNLSQLLVSPYRRAQQTAALVRACLGVPMAEQTVDWLVPESNPHEVLRYLDQYLQGDLLLVAHQPLLGELAGLLLHGHREQPLHLPTAAVVELEAEYWLAGSAQLCALHIP